MDLFTISDIENLSGIKAHTLRIWEQRYNLLQPKRKESLHRYYDNEDLKQILQIAHLNRNGYKISKIARMSGEQMNELTLEKENPDQLFENFIEQLIQACMQLDEERFNRVFQTILMHLGFEKVVQQIFYPMLERIGMYWVTETTRPVQEHFASYLITKKILVAINAIEQPKNGEISVLFNPAGEHHEIPILFIQYLLKKSGKRIRYFGTDVSIELLKEYCKKNHVDRFHLHVITNFSNKTMDGLIGEMLQTFPEQQIIVSGPLVQQISLKNKNLKLIRSFNELLVYCTAKCND